MDNKLVIAGNPEEIHVGAHFLRNAEELGLETRFCDTRKAFRGLRLINKVSWHLRGHCPASLSKFSKEVVELCRAFKPGRMLSVGLAPVRSEALMEIKELGIKQLNYLTDDPWNPAHRARWIMKSLPAYDYIFSPRKANIGELKSIGCREVFYLPFAYEPRLHFSEPPASPEEKSRFCYDILFIGGADRDRIAYISAIIKTGFRLGLYGGYWERFRETKAYVSGYAGPGTFRKAIGGAKVSLCLTRRANRDGHSMRSFEIPAVGGCMLTEDTPEHREIFGEEGKNALYFKGINEMIKKIKFLLNNPRERGLLSDNARALITGGNNTYKDRLLTMLARANS